MDLSKQQALHADPKAIQKIIFTGNLNLDGNTFSWKCFSLLKKEKKPF